MIYIYEIGWENPSEDKTTSVKINSMSELVLTIRELEKKFGDKITRFCVV
jgi:hypothetical protein